MEPEEAVHLYRSAPLAELSLAANLQREKKASPDTVTFVVDRNINYTNVCTVNCSFCAFYRPPGDSGGYLLTADEIVKRVGELVALGGTQVMLQGGLNPAVGLDYITSAFGSIRKRHPSVDIHSLTAVEVEYLAEREGLTIEETLKRLREAGMKSLPGGGAEVLVDAVRGRVSPLKTTADAWFEIHRTAHRLGMPSTATLVFGLGETIEERVEHLSKVRALQDETRGFTAFIPWSYRHDGSVPLKLPPTTSDDYLRTIAISRLFLDNIAHIQAGWVTEGPRIAQIALKCGADDWGGVLMQEEVIAAGGTSYAMSPRDAAFYIGDAGYTPVQRDTYYKTVREWG